MVNRLRKFLVTSFYPVLFWSFDFSRSENIRLRKKVDGYRNLKLLISSHIARLIIIQSIRTIKNLFS